MRVLVLGRVFSGLKAGLAEGRWSPRGVPAFYRLVEGLKAAPDCTVLTLLAEKDADPRFRNGRIIDSSRAGTIAMLGFSRPSGGLLRRMDMLATELAQLAKTVWRALSFRPDVVYATYAMVIPAAVLSRLFGCRVVVRLMGLFPNHRAMIQSRFSIYRWALRSPFHAVVCTEDGSDPGALLPRLIHPGTELVLRLNGCDAPPAQASAPAQDAPVTVLFLGRLEDYKGCDVFVDAALTCLAATSRPVRFEIVGDGPLRAAIEDKVRSAGKAGRFTFAGALPHEQVMARLAGCDVYVSVNFNGNLSNANLEALAAGACMVIPTSDPSVPLDTVTDRLLPDDVAVRYDRFDPARALARVLAELIERPERVQAHRAAARHTAGKLLKTWAARIDDDIALLRRIAARTADADRAHRSTLTSR